MLLNSLSDAACRRRLQTASGPLDKSSTWRVDSKHYHYCRGQSHVTAENKDTAKCVMFAT
jgi:hypothetical protein